MGYVGPLLRSLLRPVRNNTANAYAAWGYVIASIVVDRVQLSSLGQSDNACSRRGRCVAEGS